eukprot:Blabericola_migrator_1__5051@NODE_2619_length_2529_cov_24_115353_g1641_i0_p2_GENE_NODE_2619_length_2529_cov_24_115353_g1641_i0NODE_2619_length_2529_cov_24_115353_g1641_i0_p2_ORF_typecomplete_len188_score35_85FAM76/PF16046_5/0_0026PKcGMP_CC/PF16808_5/0_16Cut12/PF11500_8/0_27HTHP/PF11534_8/3_7e02HTHP/PF11534_8/0_47TDA11/PF17084_5/1_NODE_2619_length_2529_cov_24_115353_g1641_i019302493
MVRVVLTARLHALRPSDWAFQLKTMKWLTSLVLFFLCACPEKSHASHIGRSLLQISSRTINDVRARSALQTSDAASMLQQQAIAVPAATTTATSADLSVLKALSDPAGSNVQSAINAAQTQGAQAAVNQLAPKLAEKEVQVAQKDAQVAQLTAQLALTNATNATASGVAMRLLPLPLVIPLFLGIVV